jgi:two-component system chemotaxis response regulator CheY
LSKFAPALAFNLMMKRILVVDDSVATCALISAALADVAEIEISRVSSGLEAIKLLRTTPFDLVLTDVHMPDIDGLELLRFIKADDNLRRIPVVIISTETPDEAMRQRFSQEASDYLIKPFTAQQLRGMINKHLSRK